MRVINKSNRLITLFEKGLIYNLTPNVETEIDDKVIEKLKVGNDKEPSFYLSLIKSGDLMEVTEPQVKLKSKE